MIAAMEGLIHPVAGVPIVVTQYLPKGKIIMLEGVIYTDSMDTIEHELNNAFLKSCGIAPRPIE